MGVCEDDNLAKSASVSHRCHEARRRRSDRGRTRDVYPEKLAERAYLQLGYRCSATSCSQLAAVTPSGHLRGAAKEPVRLIVVSDRMPLLSSPIQTLMPTS